FAEPDERITREPFATFHALQQKARLKRSELQISRHRRIQIAGDIEMRLHRDVLSRVYNAQTTKNPSPVSGDGFLEPSKSIESRKPVRAPSPSGVAPPPAIRKDESLPRHCARVLPRIAAPRNRSARRYS